MWQSEWRLGVTLWVRHRGYHRGVAAKAISRGLRVDSIVCYKARHEVEMSTPPQSPTSWKITACSQSQKKIILE